MRQKCFPDLCFYTYCCPVARWVILSKWIPARDCYRSRPERLRPPKRTPRNLVRMIEESMQERRASARSAGTGPAETPGVLSRVESPKETVV